MEPNIVKCSQCNIVISEVLSFIQNKIDIMDNISLIQICKSAFSEEDVEGAKKLLYQAIPNSKRLINRKSKGKIERDLADIIDLFKQTDPELIPVFVARDLQKLPPITFDHVDVTNLLKNILLLLKVRRIMLTDKEGLTYLMRVPTWICATANITKPTMICKIRRPLKRKQRVNHLAIDQSLLPTTQVRNGFRKLRRLTHRRMRPLTQTQQAHPSPSHTKGRASRPRLQPRFRHKHS